VLGALVGAAGALAVAVGGVLPWAHLTVFGMDLNVPGVVTGVAGATTLLAALIALTCLRAWPLVAVLCGLAALVIGARADEETGRVLRKQTLAIEVALMPVNAQLMRAGLPPVEPFPPGQRRRDLIGPGPRWALWGGAVLALGATLRFAAGRLAGACSRCGVRWPPERLGTITYCPACGERVGSGPQACRVCRAPARSGDAYCAACGSPLA
jgi:hypothetical protein